MRDTRVSIRPDIVIKNLFFSKPRGSGKRPDVMEIDSRQIERGKAFMKEHAGVLSAVEKRFGTSPRIITAILMIESRLGTYPMPYNVVNAYANLAFLLDPKYLKEVQDRYGQIYPQLQEDATIARAKRKKVQMGHYLRKYGWREDAPPEQKRRAVWHYNRSGVYVNTIMMTYEELGQ